MATSKKADLEIPILARVTCPNCWHKFPPEDALWISQHPDLNSDPRLGEAQRRFLPTRFNIGGDAFDERDYPCTDKACPKCHLGVPQPLFEIRPFFLSVIGAPASGKSYLLAAMTWRLREMMDGQFCMSFLDAEEGGNSLLHEYENEQFRNLKQDTPTKLEKTKEFGDENYNVVTVDGQPINYVKPFLFALTPTANHPHAQSNLISRVVCLYDNAGESFEPNKDTATAPVTRHLAHSEALLFLFDPTQDTRFRKVCQGLTNDPQMADRDSQNIRESKVRQDIILTTVAQRVRKYKKIGANEKHPRPLIVLVTKFDCWSALLDDKKLESPWIHDKRGGPSALKLDFIHEISSNIRALLVTHAPELVSVAESFCDEVVYLPVSATGCSPEVHVNEDGVPDLLIRPKNIDPIWAEIPLLYTLCRWTKGIIPKVKPKKANPSGASRKPETY